MKKLAVLLGMTATVAALVPTAFAGSYVPSEPNCPTVSASCSASITGSPGPMKKDEKSDPATPANTSYSDIPFRVMTSSSKFTWTRMGDDDFSNPADYKVTHTYRVDVHLSASRNNPAAGAQALADIQPPLDIYPPNPTP